MKFVCPHCKNEISECWFTEEHECPLCDGVLEPPSYLVVDITEALKAQYQAEIDELERRLEHKRQMLAGIGSIIGTMRTTETDSGGGGEMTKEKPIIEIALNEDEYHLVRGILKLYMIEHPEPEGTIPYLIRRMEHAYNQRQEL